MSRVVFVFILLSSVLLCAEVNRVVSTDNISSDYAGKIVEFARIKANELEQSVSVSISDASGNLVYFERMDAAVVSSIEVANSKSYTAAVFQKSTRDLTKAPKKDITSPLLNAFDKVTTIPGGIPILNNGVCIGGIGVSGSKTSEKDDQIAVYALSKAGMTDITTEEDKEYLAQQRVWLMTLDAEEYEQMWLDAAPSVQGVIGWQEWGNAVKSARQNYGNVKERKFYDAEYLSDVPEAPEGEYVTVRFKTKFGSKAGIETITTVLENNVWYVSGYYLKPDLSH